ncbi:MAG: T9SS C-terminal target domain-containing protein, partial [Raineya sp.]|nr:T9SS C-terminal target domain-containing protein [Raineya sp.]
MMKTLYYSLLAMAVLAFAACNKKKDETPTVQKTPDGKIIVQGEIKGEVTWKASEKYLLRGFVYVTEGSTLTIEPGTKIFGDKDSKGTLIVERGGKIFAEGTVDNPIVFTSNLPAGSRGYGDWGGVVIAGNAPTNQVGASMEGGIRGTFGGSDPNDNSGVLKY